MSSPYDRCCAATPKAKAKAKKPKAKATIIGEGESWEGFARAHAMNSHCHDVAQLQWPTITSCTGRIETSYWA